MRLPSLRNLTREVADLHAALRGPGGIGNKPYYITVQSSGVIWSHAPMPRGISTVHVRSLRINAEEIADRLLTAAKEDR